MTDEDIPGWLRPGAIVEHTLFGRGEVLAHGEHKGVPAILIRFSGGDKALAKEFGIPQLSPASSQSALGGLFRRLFKRSER